MFNFKPSVPKATRVALKALVEAFDHDTFFPNGESVSDTNMEPIEGNHVSGWIPMQDGGFQKFKLYVTSLDSTYSLCKEHTAEAGRLDALCREDYTNQYNDPTFDGNDWEAFETEWWNDCFAEAGIRAYVKGDHVHVVLYVNFELPNFREKYDVEVVKCIVSIGIFTAADPEIVLRLLKLKLDNRP